jgi:Tfp pilus assembly protein PilF
MSRTGPHAAVALAILLVLTVLAVLPAIDAPFTFDEDGGLRANRALRPGSPPGAALAYRFSPDQTRPLFFLSLWLDARLFGLSPRPFRLVNLGLHLIAGVLVYLLLRRLAAGAPAGDAGAGAAGAAVGPALAGAAVFLLHPVQSESIIYIWARSGVLSTLFALAALLLALRAGGNGRAGEAGRDGATGRSRELRRAAALTGALAAMALGLAAKEEAIVVPIIFILWWRFAEGRPVPEGLRRAALLCVPALLFLAARAVALGGVGRQVYARGIADNILGQTVVSLRMLRLLVWPAGQSIDHPVTQPVLSSGIAALLSCAVLAAAAAYASIRLPGAARRAGAGLLVAASGLLLYWIVPLPDLMSERRFYLPMIGIALMASAAAGSRPALLRSAWRAILPALLLGALLTPLLHARARVWADPGTLWSEAARQAPDRARPLINLGVMAAERDDLDAASDLLDRAVALEPDNPEALFNRGKLRLDRGDVAGAETDLQEATRHGPLMTRAWINLAVAGMRRGDLAAAEPDLRQALSLDPDEPRALTNLAEVLRATGRSAEALPLYRQALEADPSYAHAAVRLGVALEAAGDRAGALAAYGEYLRRGPPGPDERDAALARIRALETGR